MIFIKKSIIAVIVGTIVLATTIVCITVAISTKHIHSFGDWEVFMDSACNKLGIERRYCACGEYQDQSISKKDHTEGEWVYDESSGNRVLSCEKCGKVLQTDELNDHSHEWTSWIIVKEATCTTEGKLSRSCECGIVENKTLDMLEHTYGEWKTITESTCTEKGIKERICECGAKQEKSISTLSHEYGEWIVIAKPTCTQKGTKYRTCKCGEKQEKDIETIDHLYGNWVIVTQPACETDGLKQRTCTCGETQTETVSMLGHRFGHWKTTKAPTCTEEGILERSCPCGKVDQIPIDKEEHGEERTEIIGNNICYYCIKCNEMISQEIISYSVGLQIENGIVYGLGSCTDTIVKIPAEHNGNKVYKIADGAFKNASNIETVILPNTIKTIDKQAFAYCKNLKSVYINDSIENIGMWIFDSCNNLETLYFSGTEAQWNDIDKDKEWDSYSGNFTTIFNYIITNK